MLRVANGQGFWGDLPQAPVRQVKGGEIDVLSLEYLAEVTLGILARSRRKGRGDGFVPDVVEQLEPAIEEIIEGGITVVTSAGGLNPLACAEQLNDVIEEHGQNATVAAVHGDDVLEDVKRWNKNGELDPELTGLLNSEDNELLAAQRYMGSRGIARAIREGADVVVTGRVTDTALVLGPAMAEFDWNEEDWGRLANGIVAGHLLECGGQATGGNFTGRSEVPEIWDLGFPIAEIEENGNVTITKHESLGGTVSEETVAEQLLYELTDPDEYLTPDVTVDFTGVELVGTDTDRVEVRGIRGGPPPETDKISALVATGYQVVGHLTYCGPDPVAKARRAEDILRRRLANLDATPEKIRVETVGYDACHGELSDADPSGLDEVVFRVAASDPNRDRLNLLGKQLMGLILTGPDGATGFAEGRPRPRPVIEHHAVYRDRNQSAVVEWV